MGYIEPLLGATCAGSGGQSGCGYEFVYAQSEYVITADATVSPQVYNWVPSVGEQGQDWPTGNGFTDSYAHQKAI